MKIAIEGCAHGELECIYDTIQSIEKAQNIKVDLLLCCGDFQATRNLEDLQTMAVPKKFLSMCTFYKYYSGELVAPVLTIFIGGNHEASNFLQELPYGGWVAPNIYYMGYAGVVNVNGIRIAGISGIYKGHDFLKGHYEFPPYNESTIRSVYHVRQLEVFRLKQLSGKVDIFMSHDWPRGICDYGNKAQLLKFKRYLAEDVESGQLGSRPLEDLLMSVKPDYWFAAHLHCKFAALVPHVPIPDNSGSSSDDEEAEGREDGGAKKAEPAIPVTRFLALDKCLPQRRFLQLLDFPNQSAGEETEKLSLSYDAEWLSILQTTNHLTSVKNHNYYLPGKMPGKSVERSDFTPTPDELEAVQTKLGNNLSIPQNFCRTVPAYHPEDYQRMPVSQPEPQLNPQCTEFCTLLGIDDPLSLAVLAAGKELPPTASREVAEFATDAASAPQEALNESLSTPLKRKLNLTLPAPATACADTNEIALPDEEEEEQPQNQSAESIEIGTDAVELCESSPPPPATTAVRKFKRRNQNIYQANDNDDD